MLIITTFLPPEKIRMATEAAFPTIQFEFYKDINQADASFFEAEVLLTYGEDLTEELIRQTTKLKWIMVVSAGLEKMPLKACQEKGIIVTNARGIHKIPMAEFTIGVMLQYVKQAKVLWHNNQISDWQRRLPMAELHGQSVLIIGVGAIGGEIARLAKAFQMTTLGVNTSGKMVENVDSIFKIEQLEQALSLADFVVNILPSTKKTKHLLKDRHFDAMKESAVFINIGRGDVVEEAVLLEALQQKKFAHAFLDVFYNEPLDKQHPFWTMENVSVTPHISSLTKKYLPRSFEIFFKNLHSYLNNEDKYINRVDLERGY